MFNSDKFNTAWEEWKKHYSEKTFHGYTNTAERKALATLYQRCGGREDLAIQSIDYSIEKNWNAVYLKPMNNGNGQNYSGNSATGNSQNGTSTDRVETARKW